MTDPTGPAPLDVRPARGNPLARLSLVWLVPLFALIVSLSVAWQSYSNRGTLIEIVFDDASGIAAGETVIKYRDVNIGRVEDVRFSAGLDVVIVEARINKDIAPYLDDDAQFWVVTPDVSVRGISGLETVLSGVFIEGSWDTEADVAQTQFVGLDEPPLTTARQRGTAIVLRAQDGSALATGAPILHKGIQVGYLEAPELAISGRNVMVNGFIEAPYDRVLTTNTRFWDTSGFSISLGPGGVSLDVNSLASLIEGGVAFDTVVSGGAPVRDGQIFNLFDSAETARESLFDDGPGGELLNVSVLFDGSVNGLTVGSDVRFQGITIGEVIDLSAVVSEEDEADTRIQLRAILGIDPTRLGMQDDATPEFALDFLDDYVAQGLRARLATGNILSGALVVQLTELPDATAATLDRTGEPYPIVPSAPSAITDVADTADDVLQRINDLPIEDLLESAISLMNSIESLANDEQLRQTPESLVALLDQTRSFIASEDIQNVAPDVRAILAQIEGQIAALAEADVIAGTGRVVAQAEELAATLRATSSNWPEISDQVRVLLETANALELASLTDGANTALDQINLLLQSDGITSLPEQLSSTLASAQMAAADLQALLAAEATQAIPVGAQDVINQINALLVEVEQAGLVDTFGAAAQSAASAAAALEEGTASVPDILAQAETFVANANALELDTLIANAETTLAALQALLEDDGTKALPGSVTNAANELQQLLEEVRQGGAIENANAALASANSAAQAIEDAAESLPSLAAQTSALARQMSDLVENYEAGSRFNTETLSTLRDIQEAADAVSDLARTIQRNPNSLITGR